MIRISTREARQRFAQLIDSAQSGRTIHITRRGKAVAVLSPMPRAQAAPLPEMSAFHQRLALKGKPMSQTVLQARRQTRY